MVSRNAQAIFFDMGSTLGIRVPNPAAQAQAQKRMMALLGAAGSPELLLKQLDERYRRYVRWREETLIELPEQELWNQWLCPDSPIQSAALAEQVTISWRNCSGIRVLRPEAPRVVHELKARGYCLGIVSNTLSALETPDCLKEYGLAGCFAAVILSCVSRRRKPDPEIFWEATRAAGVRPERCAYVGDRPSRDVAGPRHAGFACTLILADEAHAEQERTTEPFLQPDQTIHNLGELLDLFPPRSILHNSPDAE